LKKLEGVIELTRCS